MRISAVGLLATHSLVLAVCCSFVAADDEWIDPYDMINYDATTKTMKKPNEASSYSNVPTKRRGFIPDDGQVDQYPDITQCTNKVDRLQRDLEEYKRRQTISSQQPACNPVFKRFLSKLLKEIEKLGLPSYVSADMHYDAEVKLSEQMVAEIQKFLKDDGTWTTGALDDALSQILINFKLHDYEAWKWRFEDTFGVELEAVIKVSSFILIIVLIITTEVWSTVSWFLQFRRMFVICFIISLVWNWFYLYKIEFAKHQANVVKVEDVNDKCVGLKKFDWKDNFKEWFRTTWTLQDDPCQQYYEVLMVNPILLVPPTKAISVTITSFFTDPLKQIGHGISEFLRALLKDLPVHLQIPVLLTVVLSIVVFVYVSAQAAVHHAVARPLRGGRGDPPPPAVQQPTRPLLREQKEEEDRDPWAQGDADRTLQPRPDPRQEGSAISPMQNQGNSRPEVQQRRHVRPNETMQRVYVETLRNADDLYSGDETDIWQVDRAEGSSQPQESELLNGDVAEEGNKTSTHTSMKPELSKPAPKEPSAKSDDAENQTTRVLDESTTVLGAASKKENVETIGTPVQKTVQF
ncbi:chloride channel CLIC-like protein 1 [Brachyhypopomus gauderio]|uniref:chloride channel CLIC-like protein 1 n=1 Tax=Brachyhypopomus gauderio TaxID=698409 RepID=UPI0040436579